MMPYYHSSFEKEDNRIFVRPVSSLVRVTPSEIHGNEAIQMREYVKCIGALHGIVFWRVVLIALPPLWLMLPLLQFIGIIPAVLVLAWLCQKHTVIIVTNHRVTIKRGLSRIVQMNVSQIESVDVVRPYIGMMFNYGTVTINGAGGRRERVNAVADPFRLQKLCG
jgi:Bacterial PH domain